MLKLLVIVAGLSFLIWKFKEKIAQIWLDYSPRWMEKGDEMAHKIIDKEK